MIGQYLLRQKLKKQKRIKHFGGMHNSKTFGILFDATDANNYTLAKTLSKKLTNQGKGVKTLGYSHSKTLNDQYIGDQNNGFINKKHFNWLYQPTDEYTKRFTEFNFDVLIVLSHNNWFPIQYICHLSNASFKVSKRFLFDDIFDFMIEVTNKAPLNELAEQILHYLNMFSDKETNQVPVN